MSVCALRVTGEVRLNIQIDLLTKEIHQDFTECIWFENYTSILAQKMWSLKEMSLRCLEKSPRPSKKKYLVTFGCSTHRLQTVVVCYLVLKLTQL